MKNGKTYRFQVAFLECIGRKEKISELGKVKWQGVENKSGG